MDEKKKNGKNQVEIQKRPIELANNRQKNKISEGINFCTKANANLGAVFNILHVCWYIHASWW